MKLTVYCDGFGTTGGPAGVAFIALDDRGDFHLERPLPLADATNHSAEVLAACYALRELPAGSDIVVWSDSEYLVKGWNEWLPAWRKNQLAATNSGGISVNRPYWEKLIARVGRHAYVEFTWLRKSDGHEHAKHARRLAHEARATALTSGGADPDDV